MNNKTKISTKNINEEQILLEIQQNNLYVPDQFVQLIIEYQTPSKMIAYEPVYNNQKLIGWAILWDVTHYTFLSRERIRLIGVFIQEKYRGKGLATQAIDDLLKNHKMTATYKKDTPICYCNAWNKFETILQQNQYLPRQIKGISVKKGPKRMLQV